MTGRPRVFLALATAAIVAAAIVVGVTLATRTDVAKHRSTPPPFVADPTTAAAVSRDVREALRAWPTGTVRRLRILRGQHPGSALVRLELGLALALSGDRAAARQAWLAAERVQPDSPSAVHAADLRHPDTPPGNPPFIASFAQPRTAAERLLARGSELQAALRPRSAERAFAAAAELAPNDAEAQVAAAVGLYDKEDPTVSFSRLGPLARRFPHAQTVRFHLGLLLVYFRAFPQARKELARAVAEGPGTILAKRARVLLQASRKA